ncbi:hypothetical protein DSO57_1016872 [Entomophthora muscae]|uniref:Uncharacterized protein n=1 Tax=Entomophthora muscae TaxID=34485 RepID=A0ACC2TT86_9FUNG|nr:hypothetical protein DSO57_1016872 [Entomophthora muscae]
MERVAECGVRCLRFGNINRMRHSSLRKHYLEAHVEGTPLGTKLKATRESLDEILAGIQADGAQDWVQIEKVLSAYRKDINKMEWVASKKAIPNSQVVFSTLNTSGGPYLSGERFDVLILDEATQASEPECWVGISHCKKVVLAGDHHQLPPVMKNPNKHLELTLFERLLDCYSGSFLSVQYRMHATIMAFPMGNYTKIS